MLEKLKLVEFDLYLLLLGILSFLSHIGKIGDWLFPIIIVIAIVIVLRSKPITYFFALVIFMQMGLTDLRDNVTLTTIHTTLAFVVIIIDVVKNRKITKLGKLFTPLAILSGFSIITAFNAPDLFTAFAGFIQIFSVLIAYVYFVNSLDKDEKNLYNISKLFLYAGMFVTFQMIYFVMNQDMHAMDVIKNRVINLGWENINIVIYTNLISIPLGCYLIVKSKAKLPYMIITILSAVGIFMTLSRSSILTVAVYALLLIPYVLINEKSKRNLLYQGIGLVVIAVGTIYFLQQYDILTKYFDSLFGRDLLAYMDRWVLLEKSVEVLKEYPLFGGGGLYSSRYHLQEFGPLNYHNTIAQASTLGIAGLIGFGYLFYEKTKLILQKKHTFRWVLLVLIFVTAFINGSLQPMYFYTTYMLMIFMIIAAFENVETTEKA